MPLASVVSAGENVCSGHVKAIEHVLRPRRQRLVLRLGGISLFSLASCRFREAGDAGILRHRVGRDDALGCRDMRAARD